MFLLLLSSLEERELFLDDESKSLFLLFFLEGIVVVEGPKLEKKFMQETKYGISISQYIIFIYGYITLCVQCNASLRSPFLENFFFQ